MRRDYWIIAGLALIFYLPFLGSVHLFDWDEINFAECAREMLLTGDYMRPQIDFEPFWEKPPLFLWLQALSMQVFGMNEFAARFPNAIAGLITMLLAYHIGYRLHDRVFGWVWALAWVGSILPHLYFRSGIIDPWFNLFIFIALYGFIEFRWQFFTLKEWPGFWRYYRHLLLGGAALGLAILTKGPTAYLIVFLVLLLYFAKYKFRNKGYVRHVLVFSLSAAAVTLSWFGLEVALHGPWFVETFVQYQIRLLTTPDAGHAGFWGYHVVVLLLGCFPASVLAIPNLWGDRQSEDEVLESDTLDACKRSDFSTWMQILFWVVLILFSLVRTKIVHYSSLAYFPLTYLAALSVWRMIHWNIRPKVILILLPLIGGLIGLAVMVLPLLGMHPEWIRPLFEKDAFAMANLEAEVEWSVLHGLPGLILLLASLAGWWYWKRYQGWQTAQALFAGGAAFISFTLILVIENIEAYSQRAAIEFYESKAGEDCFVKPVGFKSYAHLFYTDKPPLTAERSIDDFPNLLEGDPGKKVYFVAKINKLKDLPERSDVRELYRKNGFVFFERILPDQQNTSSNRSK